MPNRAKHYGTHKHKTWELMEQNSGARPSSLDHSPYDLLQDLLALQDGHLKAAVSPIAALPPSFIRSLAGGKVFLEKGTDTALKVLKLALPRTFKSSLAWEEKPKWEDCMNDFLCRMDQRTQVFMSGEINGPCTTPRIWECFEQLRTPDLDLQYYVINIPSDKVRLCIPDNFDTELDLGFIRPKSPRTTVNLTPRWTRVRPHIGM